MRYGKLLLLLAVATMVVVGWSIAVADEEGGEGAAERPRRTRVEGAGERRDRAQRRRTFGAAFDYAGIAKELGLSDAQAAKLAGLIVNQQMQNRLRRVELTDAQQAKVKALCLAAGPDLLAADGAEAQAAVTRGLYTQVTEQAGLTDEQKARMGGRRRGEGEREGRRSRDREGGEEGGRRSRDREGGEEGGGGAEEGGWVD